MASSKRYEYSCATCGNTVSKPAVSMDKENVMLHGLHGWKCSTCGPTSVKRRMKSNEK